MTNSNSDKSIRTQEALLKERMGGKLPIIDIAGHPFYVDTRMRTVRPHDDFSTEGIPFSAFDEYEYSEEFAWIPYDPKKHEVKQIDITRITALPTDWIIVEIPDPWRLDPYGYARDFGWDIEGTLNEYPLQENLKARIVPWEETEIAEIIERNLAKQHPQRKRRHKPPDNVPNPSGKTQGPKR